MQNRILNNHILRCVNVDVSTVYKYPVYNCENPPGSLKKKKIFINLKHFLQMHDSRFPLKVIAHWNWK